MGRTLKRDHSLQNCRAVPYCGAVCFCNFTQVVILENLSILDLALTGVKGLSEWCSLAMVSILSLPESTI